MNLFETLKQFKNISPDPAYAEKSKRAILATNPAERWSLGRWLAHTAETGVAVALVVFFIMVITGQLSGSPVSPIQFSVIDPQTLHAEAQAVDIQIQLAKIAYQEPATTTSESTAQIAAAGVGSAPSTAAALSAAIKDSAVSSTPVAGGTASSTTTSTPVTVDQALKALSQ